MKTIVNFCPTGMIPTKSMNENVPITPTEIIEQTHEAYEIGITLVNCIMDGKYKDGNLLVYRIIYIGQLKELKPMSLTHLLVNQNMRT